MRCARAVATMRRSAGSPWNEAGRPSSAITTSTSSGTISITAAPAASLIHTSKGRFSTSRPFACSISASQRLTAAKRNAARDASRSNAARSRVRRRSEPSSHQSQTWVSAALSPRCLEILFADHRFLRFGLQFSRPAKDLPSFGKSLARCRRGREPGDDLATSLDVHRFPSSLYASNDIKAACTESRHRNVYMQFLHGHLCSGKGTNCRGNRGRSGVSGAALK